MNYSKLTLKREYFDLLLNEVINSQYLKNNRKIR